MVKVPGFRVPSGDAAWRTLDRRTKVLRAVREITSGGDSTAQLAAEIHHLSKAERENLLQEVRLPVAIPPSHALAMKVDLGIPWNKLRILRR